MKLESITELKINWIIIHILKFVIKNKKIWRIIDNRFDLNKVILQFKLQPSKLLFSKYCP